MPQKARAIGQPQRRPEGGTDRRGAGAGSTEIEPRVVVLGRAASRLRERVRSAARSVCSRDSTTIVSGSLPVAGQLTRARYGYFARSQVSHCGLASRGVDQPEIDDSRSGVPARGYLNATGDLVGVARIGDVEGLDLAQVAALEQRAACCRVTTRSRGVRSSSSWAANSATPYSKPSGCRVVSAGAHCPRWPRRNRPQIAVAHERDAACRRATGAGRTPRPAGRSCGARRSCDRSETACRRAARGRRLPSALTSMSTTPRVAVRVRSRRAFSASDSCSSPLPSSSAEVTSVLTAPVRASSSNRSAAKPARGGAAEQHRAVGRHRERRRQPEPEVEGGGGIREESSVESGPGHRGPSAWSAPRRRARSGCSARSRRRMPRGVWPLFCARGAGCRDHSTMRNGTSASPRRDHHARSQLPARCSAARRARWKPWSSPMATACRSPVRATRTRATRSPRGWCSSVPGSVEFDGTLLGDHGHVGRADDQGRGRSAPSCWCARSGAPPSLAQEADRARRGGRAAHPRGLIGPVRDAGVPRCRDAGTAGVRIPGRPR